MKKYIPLIVELVLALVLFALILRLFEVKSVFGTDNSSQKPMLAIIIDDFGNNSKGTAEMLSLPVTFTGAVMPCMPYTEKECRALESSGREYILHQPMEAHDGRISWLGDNPILVSQSPQKAAEIFANNIEKTGSPAGFNNHMGSAVTEDAEKMDSIMKLAAEKNMFFVDSLTTGKSAAEAAAKKYNVPYIKRDVFLDSTQDVEKIKQNLMKAAEIAKQKGYAVAIGHVGAEGGVATAMAINQLYQEIENMGIELVPVSKIAQK